MRLVATSCVGGSHVASGDLDLDVVGGRLGAHSTHRQGDIIFIFHLGGIDCMIASHKDRDNSEEKERPRHPDGIRSDEGMKKRRWSIDFINAGYVKDDRRVANKKTCSLRGYKTGLTHCCLPGCVKAPPDARILFRWRKKFVKNPN